MQRACNQEYLLMTEAEFLSRIQACLDKAGDDTLLAVVGWRRQFMRPKGLELSAATLDRLSTERPITVRERDGHSTLANTRALQMAKIDGKTADPPGGSISRDKDGYATGILEDGAQGLIGKDDGPKGSKDPAAGAANGFHLQVAGVAGRHGDDEARSLVHDGARVAFLILAALVTLAREPEHPINGKGYPID